MNSKFKWKRETLKRHSTRAWVSALAIALVGGLGLHCGDDGPDGGNPAPVSVQLLVGNASLDFQTGTYGLVDTVNLRGIPDVGSIHSDHLLRMAGGRLYAINRYGADNIQCIDLETFTTLWQYSTGSGSNPSDLALVAADKAYVPLYDQDRLLIVNPEAAGDAEFLVGEVELGALADGDGIPEVNAAVVVEDLVYVTLQRLDRDQFFAPAGESYLIAVDVVTDELVPLGGETDYLVLPYSNPTALHVVDDDIWIGCAGAFGVNDGAIVVYDTVTGTFGPALITEAELGGDLSAFTATEPMYVLWTDTSFMANVSEVDTHTPSVTEVLVGFKSSQDIEADDTYVYVADRTENAAGVRVFRRSDRTEVTDNPISTGLPPLELQLVDATYRPGR